MQRNGKDNRRQREMKLSYKTWQNTLTLAPTCQFRL